MEGLYGIEAQEGIVSAKPSEKPGVVSGEQVKRMAEALGYNCSNVSWAEFSVIMERTARIEGDFPLSGAVLGAQYRKKFATEALARELSASKRI